MYILELVSFQCFVYVLIDQTDINKPARYLFGSLSLYIHD